MRFIYNLLFPVAFLFFVPGMILKLLRRGGAKDGYLERFAIFAADKKRLLRNSQGAVWIHAVSVGETQIAAGMIRIWKSRRPEQKFLLSTTTTTGQALARKAELPDTAVLFCPIDYFLSVRRLVKLAKPAMLVIFETEIWPNMICETRGSGAPAAIVNARISDNSAKGYRRFSFFFSPVLQSLNVICAQSQTDRKRFLEVCGDLDVEVCDTMKFDQQIPEKIPEIDLSSCFGDGDFRVLLAASTHPGEEKLITGIFTELKSEFPELRLVIVPRHAERGGEIAAAISAESVSFARRSTAEKTADTVDVLLADTTGEMLSFMSCADIVFMGKSMAGHSEGHNIIEPALLGKPVVTGPVLANFRSVFRVMKNEGALVSVNSANELKSAFAELLGDSDRRKELGEKARNTALKHRGATAKTIDILERLIQK